MAHVACHDPEISVLLADAGLATAESAAFGRRILEGQGLTRPGKDRISPLKVDRAYLVLRQQILLSCGHPACEKALRAQLGPRSLLRTASAQCAHCSGSAGRRLALHLAARGPSAGLNILVLGGSPATRGELLALVPRAVRFRLIDGISKRAAHQARRDAQWADIVVVWASTQLRHKVSRLYTDAPEVRGKIITVARRGVIALLEECVRYVDRRTVAAGSWIPRP